MNFQYDFTEKQKALRKEWLLLTIMLYFVFMPFRIGHLILNPDPAQNPAADREPYFILTMVIVYAFFSFLYFYVLYRCAYKKPGTRYLTVLLVITAVGILRELGSISKSLSMLDQCLSVVSLLAYSWWCVLSYRLRELNHKIKALKRAAVEPENLTQ